MEVIEGSAVSKIENSDELTDDEIIDKTRKFVNNKKESKRLVNLCVGDAVCQSVDKPFVIFMAGSPGAGKTEWSKRLLGVHDKGEGGVARIDADEFREFIPGYNGSNSSLFQYASSTLLDRAFNHAVKRKKNCIVDTTFSKEGYARRNVGTALNNGYVVTIVYVFQEPKKAWSFTQKRELVEGRKISKEAFVWAYMNAPNVVDKLKQEYGKRISVDFIHKDYDDINNANFYPDIASVEKTIKKVYAWHTEEQLSSLLD